MSVRLECASRPFSCRRFVVTIGWLVLALCSSGQAWCSCTRYRKTITVSSCTAKVQYSLDVTVTSEVITLIISFENRGSSDVYFLADWSPIIGSDRAKQSFDIMIGQPALRQSELPRLVRVPPGQRANRKIRVLVAGGTAFIKYLSVTLFFATKDPGFFRGLEKSSDRDELHWFTSDPVIQRRYNDLVMSDTIEVNVRR